MRSIQIIELLAIQFYLQHRKIICIRIKGFCRLCNSAKIGGNMLPIAFSEMDLITVSLTSSIVEFRLMCFILKIISKNVCIFFT